MVDLYRIVDEPKPSVLSHVAVRPFWPLLSLMLSGGWCAYPWFVLNGFAVGSSTRVRESITSLVALLGAAALTAALVFAGGRGWINDSQARYAVLGVTVWKLTFGYIVFNWQERSVHLFEYYGGRLHSGFAALVAALLIRSYVAIAGPWFVTVAFL